MITTRPIDGEGNLLDLRQAMVLTFVTAVIMEEGAFETSVEISYLMSDSVLKWSGLWDEPERTTPEGMAAAVWKRSAWLLGHDMVEVVVRVRMGQSTVTVKADKPEFAERVKGKHEG